MDTSSPWTGARASRAAFLLLGVALALGVLLALDAGRRPTAAAPQGKVHTVYISVTGDGPSAKAWFEGAAPAGVPVQNALDHWSERGYRVSALSEARLGTQGDTPIWLLMLERQDP
jgi:hypothetical protein